jgi:predicted RNA-binding protein YlxR (DUF448 family)
MGEEESDELTRHASRDTHHASPERTCIITREAKPKEALLRFVVGPNDQLVFDVAHKLPGRGIYVTCSKLLVAEAIAKRAFSRAAKSQVALAPDFMERVHALMEERVGDGLSFARKGGLVISGFEKVENALKSGEVAALLHASDAGEDGKKKLKYFDVPTYDQLPRELLGKVVGRENAVHVAVLRGDGSAFFMEAMRRFALFLE